MRPPGEIRAALWEAFEGGPATWRDVLPLAGVNECSPAEVMLVRRTVENMVRAGDLEACGRAKAAGERVWRTVYERAAPDAALTQAGSLHALGDVTRSWAQFT